VTKTLSVVLFSLILAAPALSQTAAATTTAPTAAAPAAAAKVGEMLIDANGGRLGRVDRVNDDGSAEILIDDRVATIPATTLSMVNGRLMTSMKKSQVLALQ
jgi:hypothetical protein